LGTPLLFNHTCDDCGKRPVEYYMVENTVWLEAVGSHNGMLCLDCLSVHLGRSLTKEDFKKDAPINFWIFEED